MEIIIEGKVKTVYVGDDADRVIIEYHDKVTAGNGEMVDHPLGKGSLCCSISSIIFEKLAKDHIPSDAHGLVSGEGHAYYHPSERTQQSVVAVAYLLPELSHEQ